MVVFFSFGLLGIVLWTSRKFANHYEEPRIAQRRTICVHHEMLFAVLDAQAGCTDK